MCRVLRTRPTYNLLRPARLGGRAAAVDALERAGLAAIGGSVAGLELLGAGRDDVAAHQRAALVRSAIPAATLVAGLARAAVRLARIDDPVAAHVAGKELLGRKIERGVARVGAR